MEFLSIASGILSILNPVLKKSKSIQQISSEIAEAADTTVHEIWQSVKPIFIEEFEEEGALTEDVEETKVVERELKKALEKDNQLASLLAAKLETIPSERRKNILKNVQLKGQNVKIGDKLGSSENNLTEKNIVEGGQIDASGDVHIGDG